MARSKVRDPRNDNDWSDLVAHWQIRPDTIYLNHGSFGPPPNAVRHARREWIARLDEQPMDFYLRQFEPALDEARQVLARFVGTTCENLVFAENATYGMNVVANGFSLSPGDEVILSDLEYGAVHKIWRQACERAGAVVVEPEIPAKLESFDQVIDAHVQAITEKTKLVILSHITSATALVLPIREITKVCRERNIAVCIDGPHAPAQVDVNIDELDCDFYCASCHKWLCSTLGSGFLYVNPRWHDQMEPVITSWGRLKPAVPSSWGEHFNWLGTRDPSAYLSIPAAIGFMKGIGIDDFRARTRFLASHVEHSLCELFETRTIGKREAGFYGSMAHVPLPPGDWKELQRQLWDEVGIEVMINEFRDRQFIRVSCHLYNNLVQLDTLTKALHRLANR